MIKRLSTLIIALTLIFGVILTLVACGITPPESCTNHTDNDGDGICDTEGCGETVSKEPDGNESSEYFNENGELILYRDGVPTFQIVSGAGISGIKPAEDLANTLSGFSKTKVELAKATETEKIKDVEIIIGTVTNRGDEYKFDIHTLGLQGYIVKQVGTKILVIAGSENYYENAINYLKSTVFGITKKTEPFTDIVMESDKNKEAIQKNYAVKDVTLDGTSIRGYSLVYTQGDTPARDIANELQDKFYVKTGIWLNVVRKDKLTADTPYIEFATIENDGKGGGLYFNIDENKNATFECEYAATFVDRAIKYFDEKVFGDSARGTVNLTNYAPDLRHIYYSDFGAVGNGIVNDFMAIKAAHDYANADKLIVHADPDATYYFGDGTGKNTIKIMTDTYWHGCKFIFDDHEVEPNSDEWDTSIFTIASEHRTSTYTKNLPFTSIKEGDKKVDFAPGFRAMLILENKNVKHFIRYGNNQDNGASQTELIIIDKDGNIDPTVPVQWTFDVITKIEVINVEDDPITIDGLGNNGRRTLVETIFNGAPSKYTYYNRNIFINRSNATITGVEHIITGQIPPSEGGTGAPYHGFTAVQRCENSVVDNFIFQNGYSYETQSTGGTAGMGTYEMSAKFANNILWSNCTQSNFFEANGSVKYHGLMGTNYCKNLTFDNMFVCSFDAHKGTYNATIKNSTCEHLNFIGEGTITLENVTIYVSSQDAAVLFRSDYGSTWEGDLIIKGLDLKYPDTKKGPQMSVFKAVWTDHYFGYQTYLPEYIYLEDIELICYSYGIDENGQRTETIKGINQIKLNIAPRALMEIDYDITKLTTEGGSADNNPYIGVKKVEIYNCPGLEFYVPDTPLFRDTEVVYLDSCTNHTDSDGDGICDTEGCGEAVTPTPSGDDENSEYFNENGELILYRDGVPTFQIVSGAGISGSKQADDLANTLSSLSKSPVTSVKAAEIDKIQDVEIIIGTVTNRGDEYKFDIHTLGHEGYAVKQVGTKIFVVAGSNEYYETAINYLKSTVFGIRKITPPFTDLVMESAKNKEVIQKNYAVKDVTLDGTSIRGYSLVYTQGDTPARDIANELQDKFYLKTGIWLNVVPRDTEVVYLDSARQ